MYKLNLSISKEDGAKKDIREAERVFVEESDLELFIQESLPELALGLSEELEK